MSDRVCPCGARLDRSSTTRSLKCNGMRMFIAMRTMRSWPVETKIGNICRLSYARWKKENSEFSMFIRLLEGDDVVENDNEDFSVSVSKLLVQVYL